MHDDLITKLDTFQHDIVTQREDEAAEKALEDVRMSDKLLEARVSRWADLFKNEHAFYADEIERSDDLNFAAAYHSLIHSPALGTLLKLEHTYAMDMQQDTEKKGVALKKLESKSVCFT